MDQMDSAALATVLPVIARDLGLPVMQLKLALTTYLVSMAIFIPICGWLARRYGARRVFRSSMLLFMAGSLGAALSGSLEMLVMGRFVQGAGAAAMVPVARIIIVQSVPREGLVQALAWWTMPAMLAPVTGPLIGGAIATWASWQWIFLINLPFGLVGWVLTGIYVPDTPPDETGPLDLPGFIVSAICFSSLIFGLSLLGMNLLPTWVALCSLIPGAVSALLWLWWFPRAKHPLLDLRLFADRCFRASVVAGFVFRIGTGAVHFLMPLLLQFGFGLSALQSGMLTFSGAIGALLSKLLATRLYGRWGYIRVLVPFGFAAGLLQAAAALFWPGMHPLLIIGYMGLGGLLRATFFAGVSAMGYLTVHNRQAGDVSILTSVSHQLAVGIGISAAGSLLAYGTDAGASPGLEPIQMAMLVLGGVSVLAVPLLLRLQR